jgi:hypothetical protein
MNNLLATCDCAHVGLPKTGSTFMQKQYFQKLPIFVGRYFSTQSGFYWPKELDWVFSINPLWYKDLMQNSFIRSERGRRFDRLVQAREKYWKRSTHSYREETVSLGPKLYSSEGLCGLSSQTCAVHMGLLKEAGVSKILFVCRRQTDFSISLWKHLLLAEDRFGRFLPFDALFGHDGVVELDWNQYIHVMDAVFGEENVLVLPYELMVRSPVMFFRRINGFFGMDESVFIPDFTIRENPSHNESNYVDLLWDDVFPFDRLPRVRRRIHDWVRHHNNYMPDFMYRKHSVTLTHEVLDDLMRRYVEPNRRLEARVGVDLKDDNYY